MQKSWNDFIIGLDKLKHPASNIDTGPFPTSGGPASGFVEFHPKYDIQKKYDAMNPEWEGIQASNAGVDKFKPDFMPIQTNNTKRI
jgi:hypothetical protein